MEKYLTFKKEEIGIKFYYVDTEKGWIQIEFMPRVYFGMGYTSEWHEYIKKTSIRIKPFSVYYFIKDMVQIRKKYRNQKSLGQPREIPIKG